MPLCSARTLGILAFLTNMGMAVMNVGFTRTGAIADLDANAFSFFGQVMILVWGLAFLFAGMSDDKAPSPIWFAFAVEKLCYISNWMIWHRQNEWYESWLAAHRSILRSDDLLELIPPVFILIYGPVDLIFLIAFLSQGMASRVTKSKYT